MSKKIKIPELTFKKESGDVMMLVGARLSYPHLWIPGLYKGKPQEPGKERLTAAFLIPKSEKKIIKQINNFLVSLAQEEKGKIKKLSETEHPKFEKLKKSDFWVLKVSNQVNKPTKYFNASGKQVDALSNGAERELYGGCYVQVKIQANATNEGQVKVWTNLEAIQFLADGEPFGKGGLEGKELSKGFGEVEREDGFEKHGKKGKKGKKSKKSKKDKPEKKSKKSKKKKDKYNDDDLDLN